MGSTNDTWLREPPSAQQMRNDILWGIVLTVGTAGTIALQANANPVVDLGWQGVEAYLWGAALTLALTVRRRFPLSVVVVCSVMFYGIGERAEYTAGSIGVQICYFMSIWTAWAWSRHRRRLLWVTAATLVAMFIWLASQLVEQAGSEGGSGAATPMSIGVAAIVLTVVVNLIYFLGAITWGLVSWRSARQRYELRVQAEQLRRQQEVNEQRAVADERVRIARDLHDAVAHHVSGIGIQAAGASRLLDQDPHKSREALDVIESSSREAVNEMHQLVSLLRSSDPERSSTGTENGARPGLAQIQGLADRTSNEAFEVTYREVGEPFDVPETVGMSLYRTAQEALANVRQHSTARGAAVVLRFIDSADRSVEVEVLDDGTPVPGKDVAGSGRGFGLQGIAERAGLHDGDTEIGPRPEGGFRVRVRVPLGEQR